MIARIILVRLLLILISVEVGRVLPELWGADAEILVHLGLVPVNAILHLIALARIIDHETFVVSCALVHDLAEKLEGRKSGAIVIENALSVRKIGLAQNKDIVDVCTERRLNAERILHSYEEKDLEPAAVHENVANILVVCPTVVVHTII